MEDFLFFKEINPDAKSKKRISSFALSDIALLTVAYENIFLIDRGKQRWKIVFASYENAEAAFYEIIRYGKNGSLEIFGVITSFGAKEDEG